MNSPRSLLAAVAALAGLAEVGMTIQFAVDGSRDSAPGPAAVFAVAFLALAWLVHSGRSWPVVALVVLFALEVVFIPMYTRSSWIDWVEQGGFLVISLIGLVVGVVAMVSERRKRVPA